MGTCVQGERKQPVSSREFCVQNHVRQLMNKCVADGVISAEALEIVCPETQVDLLPVVDIEAEYAHRRNPDLRNNESRSN